MCSATGPAAPEVLCVGLTTLDLVHRVSRLPGPDEKVTALRADLAAGGPAAGAAVTCAALGGRARLLTALGGGPLARLAAADLAACGVEVLDVLAGQDADPAVSAVTVLDGTGERSVVSRNAEGVRVTVPGDVGDLVARAGTVLVDGHHGDLAVAAATSARALGIPVVLDAGSWKPVLADLLGLVDLAVCSAAFAVPQHAEPADALLARGVAFVAVTAGPAPVRWRTRAAAGAVPVPQVTARDTLGAGDVFHGAFAHAVAAGLAPVPALEVAARVAAIRVGHVGPRDWRADPGLRRP